MTNASDRPGRGPVRASQVARLLDAELLGADSVLTHAAPLGAAADGALLFAKRISGDDASRLAGLKDTLLLTTPEIGASLTTPRILVPKPRLAYAKALAAFFAPPASPGISESADISPAAFIGKDVTIGAGVVIGAGAHVGDRTVIHPNVVVAPGVRIGSDSVIKSNSVIGQEGFGFDFEDDRTPVRMPHIGSVIIGNFVEIGALNTVACATTGVTLVEDHVKTDDHVHIAHNCTVGAGSILTAGTILSGSVKLGRSVWLGPNSSVLNGVEVGARVLTGIGTVVTKPVPEAMVVVGNPGRIIRERRHDE